MRELSKKNPFYLPKYRRLELENFCLQYPDWKSELENMNFTGVVPRQRIDASKGNPVERIAERRDILLRKIDDVEYAAEIAGKDLSGYIIMAACKDMTYECLRLKYAIPTCRNDFYKMLRKFYFVLNDIRP